MADNTYLTFRGKPLVRKGNVIFYGDMTEKFVVRFEILSSKKEGSAEIADKVSIELVRNDSEKPIKERVSKQSEKSTLFDALELGFIWLERALKEK